MREIIEAISKYFGADKFGYVYLAALVYLFCFEKKLRKRIVYPSIFIMIVIINPWLYRWVYLKTFSYAYWRALWMIPVVPVIAIAFCSVINRFQRQYAKMTGILLLSGVIILSGNNLYTTELGKYASFERAENAYKVPQIVIRVADALLNLDDKPCVLLPSEMLCYIRQYRGEIRIMYGRYSSGLHTGRLLKEVKALDTNAPCFLYIHNRMKVKEVPYLVYENTSIDDSEMARCGFIRRGSVDNYGIYEMNTEMDFSQGDYQVTRYVSDDGKRIMGYALVSAEADGKMILIDCARPGDEQALWNIIQQEGLKVYAWIVTQPHAGSVNALSEILAAHPEVDIENLCIFDGHDGCAQEDGILAAQSNLTVLRAGDELDVNGLSLKVLYTEANEVTAFDGTCASGDPVFKVSGGEKSILFCGDMDEQAAASLLANNRGELASTYLQMGRLENAETGEELCRVAAPEEVFIDVTGESESGTLAEEQKQLVVCLDDSGVVCHTDTDIIHIIAI